MSRPKGRVRLVATTKACQLLKLASRRKGMVSMLGDSVMASHSNHEEQIAHFMTFVPS